MSRPGVPRDRSLPREPPAAEADPARMRGRVLAIDGDVAIVRGECRDARVHARPGWRPGDLVDGDLVVRAFGGGDFPGPATEVARLPRRRLANLAAQRRE